MSQLPARPLVFGIYPGGATGEGPFLLPGPPDDPGQIEAALAALQPAGQPFVIRSYAHYAGNGQSRSETPSGPAQYLAPGRQHDRVLCFRDPAGDVDQWVAFLRETIRSQGDTLHMLQVAEEATNPNAATGGDGSTPNVIQAIVAGVLAAKDEVRRLGLPIQIGINATLSFDPEHTFWRTLAQEGGSAFVDALDYVGLDFFPDVFRRIAPEGSVAPIREAVAGVLPHFRNVSMAAAGMPATLPLHISEHGWATGPDRSEERQAEVQETIIRTVHALRVDLNVTHYELFALRDTDSSSEALQFGLLRADYAPKAAFARYQQLVAELGG